LTPSGGVVEPGGKCYYYFVWETLYAVRLPVFRADVLLFIVPDSVQLARQAIIRLL